MTQSTKIMKEWKMNQILLQDEQRRQERLLQRLDKQLVSMAKKQAKKFLKIG